MQSTTCKMLRNTFPKYYLQLQLTAQLINKANYIELYQFLFLMIMMNSYFKKELWISIIHLVCGQIHAVVILEKMN